MKAEAVRRLEVDGIRQQLEGYDVVPSNFGELQAFWDIMEDFASKGWGATGKIKIPRLHKHLQYKLATRDNVESTAMLKHVPY